MASSSHSLELVTAQDLKITSLIESITAPVLITYLKQVIRDDRTKKQEEAILLLGMVAYKANPPKTINYNALFEYIPPLESYVKKCHAQVTQDLRTPEMSSVTEKGLLDQNLEEEDSPDEWEMIGSPPKRRGSITATDEGDLIRLRFRSRQRTQTFSSRGSYSTIRTAEESDVFDDVPLRTPPSSPNLLAQAEVIEDSEEEPDEVFDMEDKLMNKEDKTHNSYTSAERWFSEGSKILKSIAKTLPLPRRTDETPSLSPEQEFQKLLKILTSIENVRLKLKDIIGGFGGPEKRKDALLILGIKSFLYDDNQLIPVATDSDCPALYSYIPLMRQFLVVDEFAYGLDGAEEDSRPMTVL